MPDGADQSVPASPMASAMAPRPVSGAQPRCGELGFGNDLPGAGRRNAAAPAAGGFMMLYAFGVGEAAISISGDPTSHRRLDHSHDPSGRRGQPSLARCPAGRLLSGCGGRSAPIGVWPRPPDGIWSWSPAGWGLPRCVRRSLARWPAVTYGKVMLIAGARSQADFVFAAQPEEWARRPADRATLSSTARSEAGAAKSDWSPSRCAG